MRKIVIHRPGGYDRLKLEEHPDPLPANGEVLVGVQAAGVNFADGVVRMGLYESAKKYVGWPITPGFEFAGMVLKVGTGVTQCKPGDRVFGITRFGGYSTHIVVPERQVFPIPANFSMEEAAAFPAVFMTAYHAMYQSMQVRPGMNTLVHSAAGGVGTALLQLGRIAGWRQVGVVGSAAKTSVAKSFGADIVIDKSSENLWEKTSQAFPNGFDVVFDGNGPATLKQSYESLAPVGKLVSYGFHSMFSKKGGLRNLPKMVVGYFKIPRFNPLNMINHNRSVITFNVSFLFDRADLLNEGMTDLLKWVNEGKIKPPKVQTFAFEKAADAQRAIESGQTTGKLVLQMNPTN